MFPFKALTSLLLLALSVTAAPTAGEQPAARSVSLPFKKAISLKNGRKLPDVDRQRAQALINRPFGKRDGPSSIDATNTAITYTASVGVGEPATQYTLLIDTGSSNTWIGADKAYVATNSSEDTGNTVSVTYGSGSFSGEEYIDTVTLSPGLVIQEQSIGVASQSTGFDAGIDGILGVGPTDLTNGTVSDTGLVPTVVDNLFAQGTIPSAVLGVSYNPVGVDPLLGIETRDSTPEVQNGELTFGGVDPSKFTGDITFVPITSTSPASEYWGIDQSIQYGDSGETILASTAGIVDTGTTLVLIATDAFQAYQSATGGVVNNATGLLAITEEQYADLQTLNFIVGDTTFSLTPNAQIWPRTLNSQIGGDADGIYLIVSDLGSNSGNGLDFINGYTFLERFYSVFDTDNSQVGFATTPNTDAETN